MISDYYDFFVFLGGLLILGVIVYIFFRRSLQNIFISEEEISKLRAANQISTVKISLPKIGKSARSQASLITVILLAIIIGGFLLNQFLMWRLFSFGSLKNILPTISINITKKG